MGSSATVHIIGVINDTPYLAGKNGSEPGKALLRVNRKPENIVGTRTHDVFNLTAWSRWAQVLVGLKKGDCVAVVGNLETFQLGQGAGAKYGTQVKVNSIEKLMVAAEHEAYAHLIGYLAGDHSGISRLAVHRIKKDVGRYTDFLLFESDDPRLDELKLGSNIYVRGRLQSETVQSQGGTWHQALTVADAPLLVLGKKQEVGE